MYDNKFDISTVDILKTVSVVQRTTLSTCYHQLPLKMNKSKYKSQLFDNIEQCPSFSNKFHFISLQTLTQR